jgi:hypothetical protein
MINFHPEVGDAHEKRRRRKLVMDQYTTPHHVSYSYRFWSTNPKRVKM